MKAAQFKVSVSQGGVIWIVVSKYFKNLIDIKSRKNTS